MCFWCPLGVKFRNERIGSRDLDDLVLHRDSEEVGVQHHAVWNVVYTEAVSEVAYDGVTDGAAVHSELMGAS